MDNDRKNIDFIDEPADYREGKKFSAKNLIDGSVLTRNWVVNQVPFIIFVTFLAILYIANRYHAERVVRETVEMQREVKELRFESITTAADLMYISKQSEVARMVKEKIPGLEELVEPPSKIVIDSKKEQ
ncbi:MAG: hypothetical protein J7K53_00635 [Bacteroidales bacterium]|nr:hypothetical protein [Bacteroidales bacterium]